MAIRFPKCVLAYLVALSLIVVTNAETSDEENHPKGTSPSDRPPLLEAILKPRIVPFTLAEQDMLQQAMTKTGDHTKRVRKAISKALNGDQLELGEWFCVKRILSQNFMFLSQAEVMERDLRYLSESTSEERETEKIHSLFDNICFWTEHDDSIHGKEDKWAVNRIQDEFWLACTKPEEINRNTYELGRVFSTSIKDFPDERIWIALLLWHNCADEDSSIDGVDKAMGSLQIGDDANAAKSGNGSSQVIVKETKISAEQSHEGAVSAEESTDKREDTKQEHGKLV